MRLYFIAFQFLTIVPLPFRVRCEAEDLGRSMAFFPLVGLTIGAGLAGLNFLLSPVLPRPLVDLLLVTALTAVTGALHLDGLADVCDGLAARGSRERFLAVMKDSRVGPVGAVGLVLGLLLKYEALLQVPLAHKGAALLLFPLLARFSQVQTAVGARRAREDGLGATFIDGVGVRQFVAAYLTTLAAAYLFFGVAGIFCALGLYFFTWLVKAWFQRRLGGVTGDIIGCVSELNEIVALVVMVAIGGQAPIN